MARGRCKQLLKNSGRRCSRDAVFDGYCLKHFNAIRDKLNKKKGLKKSKTLS